MPGLILSIVAFLIIHMFLYKSFLYNLSSCSGLQMQRLLDVHIAEGGRPIVSISCRVVVYCVCVCLRSYLYSSWMRYRAGVCFTVGILFILISIIITVHTYTHTHTHTHIHTHTHTHVSLANSLNPQPKNLIGLDYSTILIRAQRKNYELV